eukprot:365803-Chlamydomonas_euryale.AAC.8
MLCCFGKNAASAPATPRGSDAAAATKPASAEKVTSSRTADPSSDPKDSGGTAAGAKRALLSSRGGVEQRSAACEQSPAAGAAAAAGHDRAGAPPPHGGTAEGTSSAGDGSGSANARSSGDSGAGFADRHPHASAPTGSPSPARMAARPTAAAQPRPRPLRQHPPSPFEQAGNALAATAGADAGLTWPLSGAGGGGGPRPSMQRSSHTSHTAGPNEGLSVGLSPMTSLASSLPLVEHHASVPAPGPHGGASGANGGGATAAASPGAPTFALGHATFSERALGPTLGSSAAGSVRPEDLMMLPLENPGLMARPASLQLHHLNREISNLSKIGQGAGACGQAEPDCACRERRELRDKRGGRVRGHCSDGGNAGTSLLLVPELLDRHRVCQAHADACMRLHAASAIARVHVNPAWVPCALACAHT